MRNLFFICIAFSFVGIACQKTVVPQEDIIAEAYGEYLLPSDLKKILNADLSTNDSIALANAYIKDWLNNKVIQSVSEKNIREDDNIDKLVQEYRNSLVRHSYEEAIISERLDTFVSDVELEKYYEEHYKGRELKKRVFKVNFARFDKSSDALKDFRRKWHRSKEEDQATAMKIASTTSDAIYLYDDVWLDIEEFNALINEEGRFKERALFEKMSYNKNDDDYYYYVRVKKVLKEGDTTPLQYVKKDIRRILLHHRKNKILAKLKSDLLERELKANKVKMYNVQ